jgi:hypothetical protein
MQRSLVLLMALIVALGSIPGWAQTKEAAQEKATPSATEEKAPMMSHGMMPQMQEMMKEMQQLLGQEKITPEQKKKMQDMMGKMQGMVTQMHAKMPMAMPKEKMAMCPMMQKMEDQGKKIKALEDRLDKLEKAKGNAK